MTRSPCAYGRSGVRSKGGLKMEKIPLRYAKLGLYLIGLLILIVLVMQPSTTPTPTASAPTAAVQQGTQWATAHCDKVQAENEIALRNQPTTRTPDELIRIDAIRHGMCVEKMLDSWTRYPEPFRNMLYVRDVTLKGVTFASTEECKTALNKMNKPVMTDDDADLLCRGKTPEEQTPPAEQASEDTPITASIFQVDDLVSLTDGGSLIACRTSDDLDQLYRLTKAKDTAGMVGMYLKKLCLLVPATAAPFRVEALAPILNVCVRPTGWRECVWTYGAILRKTSDPDIRAKEAAALLVQQEAEAKAKAAAEARQAAEEARMREFRQHQEGEFEARATAQMERETDAGMKTMFIGGTGSPSDIAAFKARLDAHIEFIFVANNVKGTPYKSQAEAAGTLAFLKSIDRDVQRTNLNLRCSTARGYIEAEAAIKSLVAAGGR